MLGIIIGIILFIIVVLVYGLIMRKKVYDVVDKHESRKVSILNQNIASELGKVKNLNLVGEAQEKFELWKEKWEKIVTSRLSEVEDCLFDAEDAADHYRFRTAKKILDKIEESLTSVENDIDQILLELNELMDSEELSRKEVEKLTPKLKELKQTLTHDGYKYGKAEKRFITSIRELEQEIQEYEELVEAGNYIQAKQLVNEISEQLSILEGQITEYPEILKTCTERLPGQFNDIMLGLQEMKRDGYYVEHLHIEKDIHNYRQRLSDCIKSLEKGTMSDIHAITSEIDERITEMYDQLEEEAIARNYVESQIPNYQQALSNLDQLFSETKLEVEQLRKTYYFEDKDMEKYLYIDKTITKSKANLEELANELTKSNTAHSEMRRKLEDGFEILKELKERQTEFKEQIRNLRKDELEAKEKLASIREQLNDLQRKLKKSNLPGIPSFIWKVMEEAMNKNKEVMTELEKQPLDITEIQRVLTEAESVVKQAADKTEIMLDQAYLTEQVIQYANRYRTGNPILAAKLSEAERLFRSYKYEMALEKAAKSVEEVEPGALQKIEENQKTLSAI